MTCLVLSVTRFLCLDLLLLSCLVIGLAIPKSDHYSGEDQQHNPDFDHKAFLGEEADEFDQLAPEESKRRLAVLVDTIDVNKDHVVSRQELRQWIHLAQKKYIVDDVDRQWKSQTGEDQAAVDKITWQDYKKRSFGFLDDLTDSSETNTYKQMLKRDERRWNLVDRDKDGALTRAEFTDFLHPEEAEHMREVVVEETLEDIDKDGDGRVSVSEYISDMYAPEQDSDQVPDWVRREKEQFREARDQNKDGFMDRHEIREWIIPPDYDHSDAEAAHLILEADANKDGQLTKEEIVNKYDVFGGSQATDFGDALLRHEEF